MVLQRLNNDPNRNIIWATLISVTSPLLFRITDIKLFDLQTSFIELECLYKRNICLAYTPWYFATPFYILLKLVEYSYFLAISHSLNF